MAHFIWGLSFRWYGNVSRWVSNSQSSWETPKSGIPEGTVLGSTSFFMFYNGLPKCLSTDCWIFSDDTAAYAIGTEVSVTCFKLSEGLDNASVWASSWGMLFHEAKGESLTLDSCSLPMNPHDQVCMNGKQIPKVISTQVQKEPCVLVSVSGDTFTSIQIWKKK